MASTYLSREDSELLRSVLGNCSGESCLEIGVGYGSNLEELEKRFKIAVGTDIQRTFAFSSKKSSNIVVTDCASCFRDRVFELVVSNPPYLPSDKISDVAIDGGKDGFEVPRRILEDSLRVASDAGKILLLLSGESTKRFTEFCQENNLCFRIKSEKLLFFENLIVYEIWKKQE